MYKDKNCKKILSSHGGTTMMNRHMEAKHRIVWLNTQKAANKKDKQLITKHQSKPKGWGRKGKLSKSYDVWLLE